MGIKIVRIEYHPFQKIGECLFVRDINSDTKIRKAIFKCKCGNEFVAAIYNVKNGNTESCGCAYKKPKSHGLAHTPEFNTWRRVKARCYNKNNPRYNMYGAVGIVMSKEWESDFANFFNDMGRKPTPKHTIERIDVNGIYCKENCKWATWKEQSRNKHDTIRITFNGQIKSLPDWCEELGLDYSRTRKRIQKYKWDTEKAFTLPCLGNGIGLKTHFK